MPYCLQDDFRTSGPLVLIHPLRIAMQWFEHIGKEWEVRWCEQVFKRAVRGGNPFRDADADGGDQYREQEAGGGSVYQLVLPRYGADCLRLEFFTAVEGKSISGLEIGRESSADGVHGLEGNQMSPETYANA